MTRNVKAHRNTPIFLAITLFAAIVWMQPASGQQTQRRVAQAHNAVISPGKDGKVRLPDAEWKKILPPDSYTVLRQKGTERPYTGALLENKKQGTYVCGGCGLPLFSSKTKFESGTGWPSFYDTFSKANVLDLTDSDHGMTRTEVVCSRCGGHLGHVFDDGPAPTGLRYCINSVSLKFVAEVKPAKK